MFPVWFAICSSLWSITYNIHQGEDVILLFSQNFPNEFPVHQIWGISIFLSEILWDRKIWGRKTNANTVLFPEAEAAARCAQGTRAWKKATPGPPGPPCFCRPCWRMLLRLPACTSHPRVKEKHMLDGSTRAFPSSLQFTSGPYPGLISVLKLSNSL